MGSGGTPPFDRTPGQTVNPHLFTKVKLVENPPEKSKKTEHNKSTTHRTKNTQNQNQRSTISTFADLVPKAADLRAPIEIEIRPPPLEQKQRTLKRVKQRAKPETEEAPAMGEKAEAEKGNGEGRVFIEKEKERGNGQRLEVLESGGAKGNWSCREIYSVYNGG